MKGLRIIMGERLTKGDVEKIQAEIDDRKFNKRPELIAEVKETRAQGDLSENFEYHESKRAKNRNESRIRYLENMLKNATIVDTGSVAGVVGMDDTVTLYFPDDDLTETYKLVTSIRSNSLENRISIESPVGKAIKGHKVGDVVTVHVNESVSYDVEIRDIAQGGDENEAIKSF